MVAVLDSLSVNDHPFRPVELPLRPHWAVAIDKQLSFHKQCGIRGQSAKPGEIPLPCQMLIQYRNTQLHRIRLWAKQLEPQRQALLATLHPDVKAVLGKVHLPLFRRLLEESNFPNSDLIDDLCRGRPLVGTPQAGGALLPRMKPAEFSQDQLMAADFSALNSRAVRAVAHGSGESELDTQSYEKTLKDFARGALAGPFLDIAELLAALETSGDAGVTFSSILISPQHPVWESHGGGARKVRNITNAKNSCNRFAGLSESYIPDGVEGLAVICQAFCKAAEVYPLLKEEFRGFPSDFEGAYRQCPINPQHFRYACTVFYNPERGAAEFGFFRANPFGSNLAPNNWSEICFAQSWIGAHLLALPTPTTVDDTSTAEVFWTCQSAYEAWHELNQLTGWRLDAAKSPAPARSFRTLGVWVQLPFLKNGEEFSLTLLEDRAEKLATGLREVLAVGQLTPAQAAKWRGRLYFATSVGWYGAARAALSAFKDRQYRCDSSQVLLSQQLHVAIQFLLSMLSSRMFAEPRGFPSVRDPIRVSYSDGEGAGGIGGILLPKFWRSRTGDLRFEHGVQPQYFSGSLPQFVRGHFGSEKVSLEHITAIESAAVLVLLETFPELENCLWLHFIDNDSALYSFVKGSSSSSALNELSALLHKRCAERRIYLYVQRVESAANPADPPSRGEELPRDPLGRGWFRRDMRIPSEWQ